MLLVILLIFSSMIGLVLSAEEVRSYSLTDEEFNLARLFVDFDQKSEVEYLDASSLSTHFPDFYKSIYSYENYYLYYGVLPTFGLVPYEQYLERDETDSPYRDPISFCAYDLKSDPTQFNPQKFSCPIRYTQDGSFADSWLFKTDEKKQDFKYQLIHEPALENDEQLFYADTGKYFDQIAFFLVVNEETPFSLKWKHNDYGSYVIKEIPYTDFLIKAEDYSDGLDNCCALRKDFYDIIRLADGWAENISDETEVRNDFTHIIPQQLENADELESLLLKPGNVYYFSFIASDDRDGGEREHTLAYLTDNSKTSSYISMAKLLTNEPQVRNFVNLYDYLFAIDGKTISSTFYDGHAYEAVCTGMGGDYDGDAELSCCGMLDTMDNYIDGSSGKRCGYNSDVGKYEWTDGWCDNSLNDDVLAANEGEYDFSALNGLDGCCGDDIGCVPKHKFDCQMLYDDHDFTVDVLIEMGCNNIYGDATGEYFTGDADISTYCEVLSSTDCSANSLCEINSDLSDVGYVSLDGEYFCGKDKAPETEAADNENKLSLFTSAQWHWWDAGAANVPFKIHTTNGVDYISNGQEWFYCNATGDVPAKGKGTAIAEGENFSSATDPGELDCVSAINELGHFETSFTECQNDAEGRFYCCQNNGAEVRSFSLQDGFFDQGSACRSSCYVADNQTLGNYFNNMDDFNDLKEQYCKRYPYDYSCKELTKSLDFADKNELVPKSQCTFSLAACLLDTTPLDGACSDVSFAQDRDEDGVAETYVGKTCGDDMAPAYCSFGEHLPLNSLAPGEICCIVPDTEQASACKPISKQPNRDTCIQEGGVYFEGAQDSLLFSECTGGIAYGKCCIGERANWQSKGIALSSSATSFTQSNAFICYEQSSNNYISECCTDFSVCHNSQSESLFSTQNEHKYGYYGKGGALHTVMNFDQIADNNLIDYISIQRGISLSKPFDVEFRESKNYRDDFRRLKDWSTFDNLEFDIAYNLDRLEEIVLQDNNSLFCIADESFSTYLVNGEGLNRWHHAVVPLTDFNCAGFNFKDVIALEIRTTYNPVAKSNLQVAADSFFLSEDGSAADKNNTDNYYCAGNFGQWVKNLDGPTDVGFDEDVELSEKGPYWYACEAQASFDWTGSRCCGDDTRERNGAGEYYVDSEAACFSGATVYSDMTVGEALNDPNYNDLLYFVNANGDAAFYICNRDGNAYEDKFVSYADYADDDSRDELLVDTASEYLKTDFDALGTHVCTPGGDWVDVRSLSKSRIIAAKMYDIASEEVTEDSTNFNIFCGDIAGLEQSSDGSGALGLSAVQNNIKDSCVLSYGLSATNPTDQVLIGLGLDSEVTIKEFMTLFYQHAKIFDIELATDDETEKEAFSTACENVLSADQREEDDFFTGCDYEGSSGLRFAYNPEFNILFLAYTENGDYDFDKVFNNGASIGSFTQNILDGIKKFFSGWFTKKDDLVQETFNPEALLSLFADETIVFDDFYLEQRGNKTLIGLQETKEKLNNKYYTIEYININTSVEPLAERYYNDEIYALNYSYGSNKSIERQIISLVNPQKKYSYEVSFDWKRLTTALAIDPTIPYTTGTYTSTLGNGILEYAEACDNNTDGKEIFKFGNNSCGFWNASYTKDSNMTCDHGQLNNISCELKPTPSTTDTACDENDDCDDSDSSAMLSCGICDSEKGWEFVANKTNCDDDEVEESGCEAVETLISCDWDTMPLPCTQAQVCGDQSPLDPECIDDGCEENFPYCTEYPSGAYDSVCDTNYSYCSSKSLDACKTNSYCNATVNISYVPIDTVDMSYNPAD